MSEIERYDCEEDRSCEYEVKVVMQVDPNGYYVRHADHLVYLNEMRMDRDAQRLRADTAEAELKLIRDALGIDPRHHVGKTTAEGIKDLADAYVRAGEKEHELRKEIRLWKGRATNLTHANSATEQRIAKLETVLRSAVEWFDDGVGRSLDEFRMIQEMRAALNPNPEAESHE